MLLSTNNVDVEVNNAGGSSSSFSIDMNAKAFRVLSDTLYKNKIGSIVREISCNAYDAHTMAGKRDVAFEIHLPDNFEPWFSVKDFGVGLNEQEIRDVFTVYFRSTKDQSNDAIGAFGLGAKTPFAYTDQFTITSVKDGIRSIYSAFIGSSGKPEVVQMLSEPSPAENGVEIQLPVNPRDFTRFADEVREQLSFFDVKPKIVNGVVHFKKIPETILEHEGSVLLKADYNICPTGNLLVVQGVVAYKVNVSEVIKALGQSPIAEQFRKTWQQISSGSFPVLKCKIGEIGVTPSREDIEYDVKTCNNIANKLIDFAESVSKKASAKMYSLNDLYSLELFRAESCSLGIFQNFFCAYVRKLIDNNPDVEKGFSINWGYNKTRINDIQLNLSAICNGVGYYRYGVNQIRRSPTVSIEDGQYFVITKQASNANISKLHRLVEDSVIKVDKSKLVFICTDLAFADVEKSLKLYCGNHVAAVIDLDSYKQARKTSIVVNRSKNFFGTVNSSGSVSETSKTSLDDVAKANPTKTYVYFETKNSKVTPEGMEIIRKFNRLPSVFITKEYVMVGIPVRYKNTTKITASNVITAEQFNLELIETVKQNKKKIVKSLKLHHTYNRVSQVYLGNRYMEFISLTTKKLEKDGCDLPVEIKQVQFFEKLRKNLSESQRASYSEELLNVIGITQPDMSRIDKRIDKLIVAMQGIKNSGIYGIADNLGYCEDAKLTALADLYVKQVKFDAMMLDRLTTATN